MGALTRAQMLISPTLYILMATYNGEAFLTEQIQSIVGQSYKNWKLLIRDDGSTDSTLKITNEWLDADDRITLVQDNLGRLGAAKNFAELLNISKKGSGDYLLFCDQDDIWKRKKLEKQFDLMQKVENKHGADVPILIHSDLEVVNEYLQPVHKSFAQFQKIRHEYETPLNILLVQNFVTGCTVMINRALLDVSVPLPKNILMHDWWIALCAAIFGETYYFPESTVYYRQHTQNEVGSKGFWKRCNLFNSESRNLFMKGRENFHNCILQVEHLKHRADSLPSMTDKKRSSILHNYLEIYECKYPWQRIIRLFKLRITRQNLLTNILLYYRVCFAKHI